MRIGHPHAVPPDPPVANVHMPQWQMDMRIVTQCPHLLRFQMSHLTLSHMQFVRIPDCTAGSMRPCEPLSLPLAYAPFLTALPVMPPVPPRPSCRNPVGISPPPPPPEPRSVRLPSQPPPTSGGGLLCSVCASTNVHAQPCKCVLRGRRRSIRVREGMYDYGRPADLSDWRVESTLLEWYSVGMFPHLTG